MCLCMIGVLQRLWRKVLPWRARTSHKSRRTEARAVLAVSTTEGGKKKQEKLSELARLEFSVIMAFSPLILKPDPPCQVVNTDIEPSHEAGNCGGYLRCS